MSRNDKADNPALTTISPPISPGSFAQRFGLAVVMMLFLLVAPAHAVTIYDVRLDDSLFGHLTQGLVPGCGAVACAPTATVNSFVFLQNKYPRIYDNKLIPDADRNGTFDQADMIAAASALTELMGCCLPGGTQIDKFLPGKMKYIEGDPKANPPLAGKAPGLTVYKSRSDPNWPFLFRELKAMEDVELSIALFKADGRRIGGHAVTLTGFTWTDSNMNDVIDGREIAEIHFIDPTDGMNTSARIFNVGDLLETDFLSGMQFLGQDVTHGRIELAVSESPIPEPTTLLLLASGLAGLAWWRRRRK